MMLQPIRRLCIFVADFFYGSVLYLPISALLLIRALAPAKADPWDESSIPRLDGKVALVTGANAGIGYHTVRRLAAKGAKVYLGARSESRAASAIKRLHDENPSIPPGNLVWLPLDLSSQAQVVDAAAELRSREQRLDILVNNAGIDPYHYTTTPEGFELTMAVNHVGHWTLTYCVLPLLKATAAQEGSDVRIVTVSSSGEAFATDKADFITPKDLDDPCASPGWEASSLAQAKRYGKSKLANVLFAAELQRHMDAEGVDIISISLNPGPVKTQGAADVLPFVVRPMVWLFFKDPAEGAQTTLFAAAATEVRKEKERWKGGYLDGPGKLKSPSPRARDQQVAANLWRTTESAVRAIGVLDKS